MSQILKTVLTKAKEMANATRSFIDDIMVYVSKVAASKVVGHLSKNGLTAKEPEDLDGGAALGLKMKKAEDGRLNFTRENFSQHVVR